MKEAFKYRLKNLSWINSLFLLLTPPAAIVLTILWVYIDGFDWSLVGLGVFFYVLSGISITAGYHRLFSHKSFDAHPLIRIFFLIFGASAFQNSILKWGSDHRIHHSEVDTKEDPYNINEGFFYAHMGWILLKSNNDFEKRYVKDLLKDKWVLLQHEHYFKIAGFFGIILPTLLGGLFFNSFLGGLAVGALLKIVLLHHSTFFINSLCHYIGNKPYTDANSSKDSWFMALLTFGEGYHNFHHYFQADYRNGVRWFQFDPTKWLIQILEKLKLAYKLKTTPEFKIYAAKLHMKVISAREKYKLSESRLNELEKIKDNVIESLRNIEELTKKYRKMKKRLPKLSVIEFKKHIDIAKIELQYNLDSFNLLLQNSSLLTKR